MFSRVIFEAFIMALCIITHAFVLMSSFSQFFRPLALLRHLMPAIFMNVVNHAIESLGLTTATIDLIACLVILTDLMVIPVGLFRLIRASIT